jgi:hypothetical protein
LLTRLLCFSPFFLVFFLPSSSSPTNGRFIYSYLFIYLFIARVHPRQLGFALILFWGRWGLPVPFRVPILGAVGMPIPVPKTEEPAQADIDKYHAALLSGMTELFDDTKRLYGWEEKTLVIR